MTRLLRKVKKRYGDFMSRRREMTGQQLELIPIIPAADLLPDVPSPLTLSIGDDYANQTLLHKS